MTISKLLAMAVTSAVLAFGGPALADGDAVKGKKVFKKCAACHSLEAGKKKVGPDMAGIIGRKAATVEGYKYSKSFVALGETGLTWDETELMVYLENPKKYVQDKLGDKKAKTKMVLKVKKEDQRKDVIAYLKENAK